VRWLLENSYIVVALRFERTSLGLLLLQNHAQSDSFLSKLVSLCLQLLQTRELDCRFDINVLFLEVLDLLPQTADHGSQRGISGTRLFPRIVGSGGFELRGFVIEDFLQALIFFFEDSDASLELHVFACHQVVAFWMWGVVRLRRMLSCCLTSFSMKPYCPLAYMLARAFTCSLRLNRKAATFIFAARGVAG